MSREESSQPIPRGERAYILSSDFDGWRVGRVRDYGRRTALVEVNDGGRRYHVQCSLDELYGREEFSEVWASTMVSTIAAEALTKFLTEVVDNGA
jgi:hypothetical protein